VATERARRPRQDRALLRNYCTKLRIFQVDFTSSRSLWQDVLSRGLGTRPPFNNRPNPIQRRSAFPSIRAWVVRPRRLRAWLPPTKLLMPPLHWSPLGAYRPPRVIGPYRVRADRPYCAARWGNFLIPLPAQDQR
jgi:hypothetical protein